MSIKRIARSLLTRGLRGRKPQTITSSQRLQMLQLEDRVTPANTTFAGGVLTIDFDNLNESVTINNNGTNISLSSSDPITGDGPSFATSLVKQIVVTDSGSLTGQTLTVADALTLIDGFSSTGVETVLFNAAVDAGGGAASIDVNATTRIAVNPGANLTGGSGGVTLIGGGASTGTTVGVTVNAATITTTTNGNVVVTGTGGTSGTGNLGVYLLNSALITSHGSGNVVVNGFGGDAAGSDYGVYVASGAQITSGGSGSVDVYGKGGQSTGNSNFGVFVTGTSSKITSGGGNVTVEGLGGGSGSSTDHYGVYLFNGGQITAGGAGTVTVTGTGGSSNGNSNIGTFVLSGGVITSGGGNVSVTGFGGSGAGNNNYGVLLNGAGATITAAGSGNVSVTGTGGGSGSSTVNYGVYLVNGGQITAGGSGNVTVTGTGGSGSGNSNFGVFVMDTSSKITSGGGNVTVTGTGGGSGSFSYGVLVTSAGQITAAGAGTVTVTGTGGSGSGNNNYGVFVTDTNSKITSGGGNVTVTGTGGGSGTSANNFGVRVSNAGQITAGGAGSVTVTGIGGSGSGNTNYGVFVTDTNSKITSGGGNVTVTGTGGGSGTSDNNIGVLVSTAGQIISSGTGNVSVTGTGGSGSGGNHKGVFVVNGVIVSFGTLTVQGNAGTATPGGIIVSVGSFGSVGNASLSSTNNSNILVNPSATVNFGTLTINTGGDVSIAEDDAMVLTGSNNVGGNLYLEANGSITDASGSSLTVTGITQLNATSTANDIILDGTNNFVGVVTIAGGTAKNVELNDTAGGLILAGTDIAGTLRLTTVGGLSQTGAITAKGIGVRNSGSGNINLGTHANIIPMAGHFAASNTAAGASVAYQSNGSPFRIGTVTAGSSFAATSGITTNNGAVTITSPGQVGLEANIASTGGNINLGTGPNLVLLANPSITSGNGSITIGRNIQADLATNNRTLAINAGTGTATLQAIGTTEAVQSLNLTSGTGSSVGAIIARSGGVSITSTGITLNGNVSGNGLAGSPGPINITGAVTLGADLQILSNAGPGGTVTFGPGSTIDGSMNLTIAASTGPGGSLTLNNTVIGGVTPLTTLSLTGLDISGSNNITTTGGITTTSGSATSLLSGNISGAGTFFKNGPGTLTLSGANTYTGTTTVNGGTLLVNGSITSDTTVNSGATLGGNGTITGNVTVNTGGFLAPGTSPGILNIVGNYNQSGTLNIEIVRPLTTTTAGTDYDQVNVTGTVNSLNGPLNLIFTGSGTIPDAKQLVIINNDLTDAIVGTFTGLANGQTFTAGGRAWVIFYNGGDGNDVTLTTVPLLTPTFAFVSPTWSSLTNGTPIADADFGTTGAQPAIFGFNAFTTIAAAQAAVGLGGQIIVNAGTYAESITLAGTQTLIVSALDTPQAATINALTTASGQTINLAGSGATLTVGDATSTTIVGTITGSGNFVKQGTGTLTLSGANTYSGSTTINAGTLVATNASSIGAASGMLDLAGGTLAILSDSSLTFNKPVTVSSNSTIQLRRNSGFGTLDHTFNTLSIGSKQLTVTNDSSITSSDNIVRFTGLASFTGNPQFNVQRGTLGAFAQVRMVGGVTDGGVARTITFNNSGVTGETIGWFEGSRNLTTNTQIDFTGNQLFRMIVVNQDLNDQATYRFANTVGGGAILDLRSDSDATFNNNLILDAAGIVRTSRVNSGAATNRTIGSITINGNKTLTLQTGANVTVDTPYIFNAAGATINNGTAKFVPTNNVTGLATLAITGSVTGTGAIQNLAMTGSGQLTLSGTNTYTGTTTVTGGKLTAANGLAIPDASAVTVGSGGTLNLADSETIGSLAGAGSVTLGSNTLTTGGNNTNTTYMGVISGTGGSLIKEGTGTFTLTGVNTFTGAININAGTLEYASASATIPNTITVASGATLQTNTVFGSNLTFNGTITNNGTIGRNANGHSIFNGAISGTGSINSAAAGALTLNGNNSGFSGPITFAGDGGGSNTLTLGNANALGTGTFTMSSGQLQSSVASLVNAGNNPIVIGGNWTFQGSHDLDLGTGNVTLSGAGTVRQLTVNAGRTLTLGGAISGAYGLTLAGSGTLRLSGNNTYTGTTTVSGGTLVALSNTALGTTANGTTVASGATLDVQANISTEALAVAGSGVGSNGALITSMGSGTVGGAVTLTAASSLGGSGNLTINGAIGGGFGITKVGSGTTIFAGSNSYTGTTTVNDGTLVAAHANALGTTANGTTVASGATLDVQANIGTEALAVAGTGVGGNGALITSTGSGTVGGAVTLTADSSFGGSGNLTINGAIGGGFGITKVGSGTAIFAGSNTYTGGTTVNAGTLLVNNSTGSGTGSGNVVVNNAAILGGTGSISGSVTLNNTSRLAPGASPETLATGTVTFGSSTFFDVEIGGTSPGNGVTGYDQLIVTGAVNLGGATLNLIQWSGFTVDSSVLQSYTIIDNDGTDVVNGTFAGLAEGAGISYAGGTLYVSYAGGDGNDVVLYSQPVVNGGAGNDTLVLRQVSGNPALVEFSLNGAAFVQVSSGLPFTFNGAGGTDLLWVDTVNGDPISTGNVTFTGEILRLTGTGTETLSAGGTAGVVSIAGFGNVNFTGTTGIDVLGFAMVNLGSPSANDTIGVVNGSTLTNGGTVPSGYSLATADALVVSGTGSVPVQVRNNGTVSIDTTAVAGTDTVTITSANNSHGNTNLSVTTGTETLDVITVNGVVTASGTTTLNAKTINLNANITNKVTGSTATVVNVDDAPSGQIQDGIDVAASGAVIHVAAGTYAENLVVDRSVTILGANAGVSGKGVRGPESVLLPGAGSSSATDNLIEVEANNVTIDGLYLDGVNGSDTARHGIVNFTSVSGLTVQNSIIESLFGDAIGLDSASSAATSATVMDNWLFGYGTGATPILAYAGVFLGANATASITGNAIGVSSPNPSTTLNNGILSSGANLAVGTWSNNTISLGAGTNGITVFGLGAAGSAAITSNTVNAKSGVVVTDASWGIVLDGVANGAVVAVSGNTVGASGGALQYGINVFSSQGMSISGGSVANAGTGIYLDGSSAATSASVTGVSLSGNATGIGVVGTGGLTTLTLGAGNTVVGGLTGLAISGSQSRLGGNTLNDVAFSGQTGAGWQYITLSGGALLGATFTEVNGTAASFDGLTGGMASKAQNYAIENRITHGTDGSGLGFVRVHAGNVYVTTASGSIQRGVNVAVAGNTLNVQAGTYAENVTIDRALTVRGEQSGVDARGRVASETVVNSGIALTTSNPGASDLFRVTADNVTIDGFTFDGTTQGRYGITNIASDDTRGPRNNLVIQNNILTNFFGDAIGLDNNGGTNMGGVITQNAISQFGTGSLSIGYGGVYLGNNARAVVSDNAITVTTPGASSSQNSGVLVYGLTAGTVTVSDNEVTVGASANGVTLDNGAGGTVVVMGNTLNAASGLVPSDQAWGISLVNNASGVITIQNNTIGASGGKLERGMDVFDSQAVSITGGTIANAQVGIAVVAEDINSLTGVSLVTITNPGITLLPGGIGVLLSGTAGSDTFEVNTVAAGASNRVVWSGGNLVNYTGVNDMTLDGLGAADSYRVQLANSALPGTFRISDSGSSGVDTADVYGTAGANTFDINSTIVDAVSASTGEVVRYDNNLEALTVHGPANPGDAVPTAPTLTDGGDTFTVTPDVQTAITIRGGNPTAGFGDTLNLNVLGATTGIDLSGATVPHGSITWTGAQRADVVWSSIETLPIPLGLGGTFDFNSGSSATQAGFYGVSGTDTPTSGALSFANVGWVNPVWTFDRGAASPGGTLGSLQRDGAWGYWNVENGGVFQVSVALGQPVWITAMLGDSYAPRGGMNLHVSSDGGATWTLLNTVPLSTASSGFTSFRSATAYTPTSTALQVRISSQGYENYWVINGLEVRPEVMVYAPVFSRQSSTPLENLLLADGTTVDTYTGTGAAPNAFLQIELGNGSAAHVGMDASSTYTGFQVQADAAGAFSFQVRRPTGTTSVITVRDVTGNAFSSLTQMFSLPGVRRVDFGSPSSPVQGLQSGETESATVPEYVGLGGRAFDSAAGNALGWIGGTPGTYDRGSGSNDLVRDGVTGDWQNPGDLQMVLSPNTTYTVHASLGDPGFTRSAMYIAVIDPTLGTVTSTPFSNISTAPGQVRVLSFTVTTDSSGRMRLRFGSVGYETYWTLAALEVRASAASVTITQTTPGSVPADGTTQTSYTITGATPNTLLTVRTSAGSVAGADAAGFYQEAQVLANGSGTATFLIQSPLSNAAVDATFTVEEVTGARIGSYVQSYTPGATAGGGSIARYDFDGASVDTASGRTSVRGSTTYTNTLGYGWVNAVSEFQRTAASTPVIPALYRDGAWGYSAGVFRVKVAPNTQYSARVYVGDSFTNWPGIQVSASGTGGTTAAVDTTAMPFGFVTVSGTSDASGIFEVTISNTLSSVWVVNGIDVVATATGFPTLGVSSSGAVAADGSATSTLTITGAAAGDLITLTTAGTPSGSDASSSLPGFQVVATGASFTVTVTAPRRLVSFTDTVVATNLTAGTLGSGSQAYTAGTAVGFDFNGTSVDTQSGLGGVRGSTTYTAARGHGWTAAVSEFERAGASVSKASTSLYRDGAWGYGMTPGTFQVAAVDGTSYTARVYIGDSFTNWTGIQVSAMGGPWVAAGTPTTSFGFVEVTGTAAGGVFTVAIGNSSGAGIWVVNGVEIGTTLGSVLPLLVSGDIRLSATEAVPLSQSDLDMLAAEAIRRWESTGLSAEQSAKLRSVRFEVADLSGSGRLGEHRTGLVRIDARAAGAGWYVDATPGADEEFAWSSGRLLARDSAAASGIDLLTVLLHELGHELGYMDLDADAAGHHIMAESLGLGERRSPAGAAASPGEPTGLRVNPSAVPFGQIGLADKLTAKAWCEPPAQPEPATRSAEPAIAVSGPTAAASRPGLNVVGWWTAEESEFAGTSSDDDTGEWDLGDEATLWGVSLQPSVPAAAPTVALSENDVFALTVATGPTLPSFDPSDDK